MVKVLVIVPYKGVQDQFEELIREVRDSDIQIETTHIYGTTDDLIRNCVHDIVVARGITYRAIKEALPNLHMIEISMTGFDIAGAVAQSRSRFDPKRIAVLMHDPVINNIRQIEELCGIPIETYDVVNEEAIDRAISRSRENGVEAFIGGLTMCQKCDELGLHRIHIKTGGEAMRRAVGEAVNIARSLNQERAKTRLMQAVLNSSHDVLIAVDKDGIVTAINNQAYQTYKIPLMERVVGEKIDTISKIDDWKHTLETGTESEKLHSYNGKPYLVNCKPILVGRHSAGVLITLQNTEMISETETRIRKELSAKGLVAKYHFGNIIGGSETMKEVTATAYKYSQVDSSVLLVGETGTGKELFAHSIHNASRRSRQPFVAVNCAALPENLLESELFGYAEGAFSGASKGGKTGLFELAHRGSIFLDEIGEMPISLQAKMLRVLQEKEIRRIGDDRVIPVNVRVISATNINIREKIGAGQFRADLYYRLNLLSIVIPPLRERHGDIPVMIGWFISKFACDYARTAPELTAEAARMLAEFSWPGNVRELRNLCERMVVLDESGSVGRAEIERLVLEDVNKAGSQPSPDELPRAQDSSEEEELLRLLARDRMKRDEIAKMLGISRTTLWRRLNKVGRR